MMSGQARIPISEIKMPPLLFFYHNRSHIYDVPRTGGVQRLPRGEAGGKGEILLESLNHWCGQFSITESIRIIDTYTKANDRN